MYENEEQKTNHEDNEQKLMEARLEYIRKEYRKQEYVSIIIINVIFAFFFFILFHSVREVSAIKIYKNVYIAAVGWFLYGTLLCLLKRDKIKEQKLAGRTIFKAALFGVLTAAAKIGLDYVTDWISTVYWGAEEIFVVSEVVNVLFGFLITVILFAVFVRGKVRWSIQSANSIAVMIMMLIFYIPGVNVLKENYYYYDRAKIISLNVGAFALFMVLLWWLLNTLYDQKENENKKLNRMINVGIVFGQLILLGVLISWLNEQKICLPVRFTYPYQVSIKRGLAEIDAYLSDEREVEIPERIWWAKEIYIDEEAYSNLGTDLTVRNVPDGVSVNKLYHKESQCYFTIRESEAYIDDYGGDEKKVEIPEEVWGRKVTQISWGCFDESSIEEVIIPETVTEIEGAFHDCKNLKQIALPSQLEVIDNFAFRGSGIESIVLPESVKEIGKYAFKDSKVKEIVGIENVEYIGYKAFWGTPWEKSIEGDFVCIGDVLYLYRGDKEEVVIPSGIKEIRGAFVTDDEYPYPRNVKKVFVPETVTTISEYSFEGQEGLEVYIPETVTSLGSSFEHKHTHTIFGSEDEDSYRKGKPGCRNMIITTKGSPAIDHAIENEQARFQIITEEEMQQEKERAISGRDEKLAEEITIESEAEWMTAYINILVDNSFAFDEYALIYKNEDDIPELVGNNIYAGYQICSYSEENEIECYPVMPYGTYAREYYYLPKENYIIRASMGIDKKEHYEECEEDYARDYYGGEKRWSAKWSAVDRILLSELEKNYINFKELHYYSKEEMLDKLRYRRFNTDKDKTAKGHYYFDVLNKSEEGQEEVINETVDAVKETVEKKKIILKEVEGYEYLRQMDLASADGNVYPVMVPKDFAMEEGDRFVTYCGNGFRLSMYARELFEGETLTDFMDLTANFIYEDSDRGFVNVNKADRIEKEGLIYQICTADRVDSDGVTGSYACLAAAIPLGGTDILAFDLEYDSYTCNQESIKYLEEISKYYKIPVEPFIELIEGHAE